MRGALLELDSRTAMIKGFMGALQQTAGGTVYDNAVPCTGSLLLIKEWTHCQHRGQLHSKRLSPELTAGRGLDVISFYYNHFYLNGFFCFFLYIISEVLVYYECQSFCIWVFLFFLLHTSMTPPPHPPTPPPSPRQKVL